MAGAAPKSMFPNLPGAEARAIGAIAEEATPLRPPLRLASARSIAGSVVVHGALLLALAFALRGRARPAEPVIEFEVGVVSESGGDPRVNATPMTRDLSALRGVERTQLGTAGAAEADLQSIARGGDASGGAAKSDSRDTTGSGGRRDVTGTGAGGVSSGREVAGGGAAGSLWGVGAGQTPSAASFVYVLDRSGSMQDTFPLLEAELRRAIGSLRDGQLFNVIWFAEGPGEPISPTMMAATTENKMRAFDAARAVKLAGRTQPMDALRRGLAMKPDVLYLLSDGDFGDQNEAVVGLVRDARSSGASTVIHTILFNYEGGRGEAAVLRRIAEVGGGTYKQVSEERLGG